MYTYMASIIHVVDKHSLILVDIVHAGVIRRFLSDPHGLTASWAEQVAARTGCRFRST